MIDQHPPADELPLAAAIVAHLAEEETEVSGRPGHGVARAQAHGHAHEDGAAEIASTPSGATATSHYRAGVADRRLRAALTRLRRRLDPAVQAIAAEIAAEAAVALHALAERAERADPVRQRHLAQAAALRARLQEQDRRRADR